MQSYFQKIIKANLMHLRFVVCIIYSPNFFSGTRDKVRHYPNSWFFQNREIENSSNNLYFGCLVNFQFIFYLLLIF